MAPVCQQDRHVAEERLTTHLVAAASEAMEEHRALTTCSVAVKRKWLHHDFKLHPEIRSNYCADQNVNYIQCEDGERTKCVTACFVRSGAPAVPTLITYMASHDGMKFK
jgi:hypothetical protein